MGIATSQQLTRYYDQYRDTEVTFSKDVIRALGLDPREIYIKVNGGQWPCIVNSTSFLMAKIIIGVGSGAFPFLAAKETQTVNLRFCFINADKEKILFLVSGRVAKIEKYMNSKDLAVVTLQFTQRPPDDLIEIVGRLLEANANSIRRKEERIAINEDSKRKLELMNHESVLVVQNVPRHCVIRNLSFSGTQVILIAIPKFILNKEAVIRFEFDNPREVIQIKGLVVGADAIQGSHNGLCSASIRFDERSVPISYKLHINNYLTSVRKNQFSAADQIAQQRELQIQAQKEAQQRQIAEMQAQKTKEAAEAKAKETEPPADKPAENPAPAEPTA